MKNKNVIFITETAIMLALSTVLSIFKVYQAPLGGGVTLGAMLPVMYISFRYGVVRGVACGFVYSVIQLIQGLGNLTYVPTAIGTFGCIVLDYILPYTLIGLAGLFYKKDGTNRQRIIGAVAGVAFACVLRFACHFFGGAVIWYEITKEGEWNKYVKTVGMWMYSFVYNISYLGPDAAIDIVLAAGIPFLDDVLKKSLAKK